ncbi:DUF6452 family protein [Hanstruepera ponticola]|uniref:DUF6452 family protein n=1 Tax=Hanstruepera ponticola TaxID=2042995 RepID=UPI0013C43C6A|nr:DUF6452 family protein [Hanstruepera ponticola]
MKKRLIAFILISCIAFSCERDDICDSDNTTPRLVLAFYNIENPEDLNPKNVVKFRVQGVDNDETLPDLDGTKQRQEILLPLKTTENITEYKLHKNYSVNDNGTPNDPSDDTLRGNEDIITIEYVREEVYVSRACGFKTVFKNIRITVADDGDRWIQNYRSVDDNQIVENEDAPHFRLFH